MNLKCRLIGDSDPATDRSEDVELRIAHIACLFVLPLYIPSAWAEPAPTELPGGGQVSAGQAGINVNGSRMDVNQTSQNAGIDWRTFNIGRDAQVEFHQPNASAVAVNRIADPNGSQIMGKLNANGQVYLINPNGVLFGKGSQVNVGGLVASTLDTADGNTADGRRTFASTGGSGKIVNQGTLTAAPEGYIALLGSQVSNQGVIQARLGTAALAAGDKITLEFAGDKLINVEVDKGVLQTLVENKQLIQADGGIVLMTAKAADALLSGLVNNEGVVEARTVEEHNGVIKLLGDMDSGTVNVGGTLDASALPSPSGIGAGGEGADGGFIETSAAHVKIADDAKVTTAAANGLAGTWLIDPVDFTIGTGSGALSASGIGASTLSTSLGSGNVTITTDGSTAGNGDIFVNAPVSWSANRLKLVGHGNIYIDANLNGSGTAQLYLAYGQQTAAGNGSNYSLRSGAKVNLPAGANFTTEQGYGADNTILGDGQGTTTNWTVITELGAEGSVTGTDLQGMQGKSGPPDTLANLAGNYVLGADIDACLTGGNCTSGATAKWNGGTGFEPVGIVHPTLGGTYFTGKFDGLGHTISNLFIDRDVNEGVGLFGNVRNALLQNIGLLNVNFNGGTDGTGALAGKINNTTTTTIRNSYADGGSVKARSHYVGGLVGSALANTNISYSYANVSVESSDGGFVTDARAGGLVGLNNGSISYSYATGSVTGKAGNPAHNVGIGGLAGMQTSTGSISNSYATGAVSGDGGGTELGGLIGSENGGGGSVAGSYWDKTTTGQASTANVTGGGGGDGTGLFTAEWSTLGPFGSAPSGGAWSSADWGTGNPYPGIKALPYIIITANASQTYGSAASIGVGSILDQAGANATGLVNTGGLTWSAGTSAATVAGTTSTVRGAGATGTGYQILYAGSLTVSKAPLTVTAGSTAKTYDGLAWSGNNGVSYSGFVNGETSAVLGGTLAYGGSAQGAINAGSYAITPSGLTSGNYTVTFANGTLTVNAAPLTITAGSVSKTYNGLAYSGGNGVSYSGFINGESSAVLSGTLAYGGSSQGAINAGSYAITPSGLTSGNYAITFTDGTLTVNTAPLTVTAGSVSKTYDGLAYSGGNGMTYTGFVNGETAAVLGGTRAYGGSSQGAINTGSYAITPSGLTSGNYAITFADGTLTVNPAALTVTANGFSKIYDGQAWSGNNGVSYSGFVNGETSAVLGGTLAYGGNAQGAINAGSYAIAPSGLTSGNYAITFADGTLTVNPAALTVTANGFRKIYDGQAWSGNNGVSYSGFVNDEGTNELGGSLAYGGTAQGAVNAGSYIITPSGLTSSNYAIAYASAGFTITPATLTYAATPASRFSGQTPSGLSGTVNGFVAGDTLANSTTGSLIWTTTANASSQSAFYPIYGGGLLASNYVLVQAAGNATALTLNPSRPPQPVSNAMALLESDVLSTPAPDPSPAITSSFDTAGGDSDSLPESGISMVKKTGMSAAMNTGQINRGLTVVQPGVKLPDNRVHIDE